MYGIRSAPFKQNGPGRPASQRLRCGQLLRPTTKTERTGFRELILKLFLALTQSLGREEYVHGTRRSDRLSLLLATNIDQLDGPGSVFRGKRICIGEKSFGCCHKNNVGHCHSDGYGKGREGGVGASATLFRETVKWLYIIHSIIISIVIVGHEKV